MAIQKQVIPDKSIKTNSSGLGVSLNSVRKTSPILNSQTERNNYEIAAYAVDIRKSLLVGAFVIVAELVIYFFKLV